MERKDKEKFREYMYALGVIVDKEVSAILLKVYWKTLERHPADKVFAGFDRALNRPKLFKFPSPGDIIGTPEDEAESAAIEAWQKLMLAVSKAGAYKSVKFDDPLITLTTQHHGGWVSFCQMDETQLRFYRPQWLKTYKATYAGQQEGKNYSIPDRLCGIFELENSARFEDYKPEIVEIGMTDLKKIGCNEVEREALPERAI